MSKMVNISIFRAPADAPESDIEQQYMAYRGRKLILIAVMAVTLFIATGVALTFNGYGVGFIDSYAYVFQHLFGTTYQHGTTEWTIDYMLWNRYAPRVTMAIIAGACLAICGVAMQSVMNNPLADPYTVGISDGACFGAVSAIVMGFGIASLTQSAGLVTSAFVGGMIPAIIIIVLSNIVRMTPATAILVGTALSYIFSGLETAVMVTTDADTLKSAYLWQIGSLNGISWNECIIPAIVSIVCSVFLIASAHKLNLLSLGDDSAVSLGLDVNTFRTVVMVVVAVSVASVVSFVGIIGFVGLVAPHLVRMLIGGDNKFLVPVSLLTGALFIQVADLLSRVLVYPDELRVGLIASIIGAPIFLYLILKRKRNYGEAL